MKRAKPWALALGAFFLAQCTIFYSRPMTPEQSAAAESEHCRGFAASTALADMVRADSIERTEALYATVRSGRGDHATRLMGALITLKPLPGVTAEWLQRALLCRQVTQVSTHATGDDPYWLPDAWLDVSVKSNGDAFSVLLKHEDLFRAQAVLARARAYAASVSSPGSH